MKRSFELYLSDILTAIQNIELYTVKYTAGRLSKDQKTTDAVLRNLEIIGEAATQLSKELKDWYSDVPWRDIQDFRIVTAHHYWKINIDRIWDIVRYKLPPLKTAIDKMLHDERRI